MKDYKRIEHMRNLNDSLIWERMKRCYDFGYEDGQKEKLANAMIHDHEVAEKKAYEQGLNDAWECAKKLCQSAMYGGSEEYCREIFELTPFEIVDVFDYSASQCIEKVKAYEKRQKQTEDEIKVGDEITSYTDTNSLVIGIGAWGEWNCITAYGAVFEITKEKQKYWKKTGRHFDAIPEVLKQMNREEDK